MVQALDTLGNTKWRVNKRVLGVIDRIWANGGCLADLVDREDVGTLHNLICLSSYSGWFSLFLFSNV